MTFPRVSILNTPVDIAGVNDILGYFRKVIEVKEKVFVVTANALMINSALKDKQLAQAIHGANLSVPDSVGIMIAGKLYGYPIKQRITGIDLLDKIFDISEKMGYSVYLIGATAEVITAAAGNIKAKYPALKIAGFRDGYFKPEDENKVVEEINSCAPQFLLAGFGVPKQELWLYRLREILNVNIMIGIGGSFDVFSGKIPRAPIWMQRCGLEWLYRLYREPWRISRMKDLPVFIWKVVVDVITGKYGRNG
ncbi:MAG: WecB/TagA/CpsF family glycosyltransferase [Elusimicrobiota bacterium]